jgi:hypothetical protein
MTTIPMSAADRRAHEAASYVRRPSDAFLVDYDRGFGDELMSLSRVPVDARVDVKATVAGLQRFPGRTRMVLADSNGTTVNVVIASNHVVGRAPEVGSRIQLRGHVTQQTPSTPKGLAGYAMRVVA